MNMKLTANMKKVILALLVVAGIFGIFNDKTMEVLKSLVTTEENATVAVTEANVTVEANATTEANATVVTTSETK